jgi:hypothetical protein
MTQRRNVGEGHAEEQEDDKTTNGIASAPAHTVAAVL